MYDWTDPAADLLGQPLTPKPFLFPVCALPDTSTHMYMHNNLSCLALGYEKSSRVIGGSVHVLMSPNYDKPGYFHLLSLSFSFWWAWRGISPIPYYHFEQNVVINFHTSVLDPCPHSITCSGWELPIIVLAGLTCHCMPPCLVRHTGFCCTQCSKTYVP